MGGAPTRRHHRRHHRQRRQDVDEGSRRCGDRRGPPRGGQRTQLQQRAGPAGHRARGRRRHRGARVGDGDARLRRDRPAVRRSLRRRSASSPPSPPPTPPASGASTAWPGPRPSSSIALPAAGVAILNADDERVRAMADADARRGRSRSVSRPSADVLARRRGPRRAGPSVVPPAHAVGCCRRSAASQRYGTWSATRLRRSPPPAALGVDVGAAAAAVAGAELSASRMAVHRLASGAVVIDDAYNANPTSMAAAFDCPGRHAGASADRHRRGDGRARRTGSAPIGRSPIAPQSSGSSSSPSAPICTGFEPTGDPVAAVGRSNPGTAVLVKASRVAGLERVAARAHRGAPKPIEPLVGDQLP